MEAPAPAVHAGRRNPEVILAVIGVIAVVIVIAVVVFKLRSGSSQDLTGNWQAQQGPVTINLHLTGSGNNLTGTLTGKNSPVPLSGTVDAQVHGITADVTVKALGQSLKATCDVSSTKLVCTGTGGNQTLTLTFTRP
jgi:hypothetical protein